MNHCFTPMPSIVAHETSEMEGKKNCNILGLISNRSMPTIKASVTRGSFNSAIKNANLIGTLSALPSVASFKEPVEDEMNIANNLFQRMNSNIRYMKRTLTQHKYCNLFHVNGPQTLFPPNM